MIPTSPSGPLGVGVRSGSRKRNAATTSSLAGSVQGHSQRYIGPHLRRRCYTAGVRPLGWQYHKQYREIRLIARLVLAFLTKTASGKEVGRRDDGMVHQEIAKMILTIASISAVIPCVSSSCSNTATLRFKADFWEANTSRYALSAPRKVRQLLVTFVIWDI